MPLWLQHIIAKLRGDYNNLVSDFTRLARKLEAHADYKQKVAAAQADAASKLSTASSANNAEAAQSRAAASKIKTIVS